jgi:DNA-binding NarL/FixJ family response regulator
MAGNEHTLEMIVDAIRSGDYLDRTRKTSRVIHPSGLTDEVLALKRSGLTQKQIAAKLGITVGAVAGIISRSKKR